MMIPLIGMIYGAIKGEGTLVNVCGLIQLMCGCAACGLCMVKVGFYWWGFALRVREEGKVAAGKMAHECMNWSIPVGTTPSIGDETALQELCAPNPPIFQTKNWEGKIVCKKIVAV